MILTLLVAGCPGPHKGNSPGVDSTVADSDTAIAPCLMPTKPETSTVTADGVIYEPGTQIFQAVVRPVGDEYQIAVGMSSCAESSGEALAVYGYPALERLFYHASDATHLCYSGGLDFVVDAPAGSGNLVAQSWYSRNHRGGATVIYDITTGLPLAEIADGVPNIASTVAFLGENVVVGGPDIGPDRRGQLLLFDLWEIAGTRTAADAIASHRGAHDANLGSNLQALPDVDGDGEDDLVFVDHRGAWLLSHEDIVVDNGITNARFLATTMLNRHYLYQTGLLSDAPDWDGDGLPDVAIGAFNSAGGIAVVSGTQKPLAWYLGARQEVNWVFGTSITHARNPATEEDGLVTVESPDPAVAPGESTLWFLPPGPCGTYEVDAYTALAIPEPAAPWSDQVWGVDSLLGAVYGPDGPAFEADRGIVLLHGD